MRDNGGDGAPAAAAQPAEREYRGAPDAAEAPRARRSAEIAVDETPLRADLAAIGIEVSSVYDFVNGDPPSPEAVPVLIRHLREPHDRRLYEVILQALSYPQLRPVALEPLTVWFLEQHDRVMRWVGANALASMATLEELDAV
ncbi:MAG TPA: hypothetical protein VHM30_07930, partial [Gemmatimonadaceae bacterium]|nr:hypothetical protein [Gemmatimonadaceae bacterium]